MEFDPILLKIVAIYRSWEKFSLGLEGGFLASKKVLIDDLCLQKTELIPFKNEQEIEDCFIDCLKALEDKPSGLSEKEYKYTMDKIQQSLIYLRSSRDKAKLDKNQILARGMPWVIVEEEELNELNELYLSESNRFIKQNKGYLSTKDLEKTKKIDPELMKKRIEKGLNLYKKYISCVENTEPVSINLEFTESKATWRMMVTTVEGKITLIVNVSELAPQSEMSAAILPIHEYIGHVLHFENLLSADRIQKVTPHLGMICIHTQDAFYVEGIAQVITKYLIQHFYPENSVEKVSLRYFELEQAVRQKNVMDIIENKINPLQAAENHCKYLQGDVGEKTKVYEYLKNDAFFCCQVLSYHSSRVRLDPMIELPLEKFRFEFKNISNNFSLF